MEKGWGAGRLLPRDTGLHESWACEDGAAWDPVELEKDISRGQNKEGQELESRRWQQIGLTVEGK